jgi:hypothetical protein
MMVTKEQYGAMSQKDKEALEREIDEARFSTYSVLNDALRIMGHVCDGVETFYDHAEFLPQESKLQWKVESMEEAVAALRAMQGRIAETLRKVKSATTP